MTTLPTWAVWVISFGSPTAGVIGATFGPLLLRRGAAELEARSRRELLVKQMTWAAEMAVDTDPRKARLGVSHLTALADSELADSHTTLFVQTTMKAVIAEAREKAEQAGPTVRVLRSDDLGEPDSGRESEVAPELSSAEGSTSEEVSGSD